MVVTYGFWNTIGKFLANLVLMVCQQTDPLEYKVPILTQWGFLGVMLPVFLWLPETAGMSHISPFDYEPAPLVIAYRN